MEQSGDIRRSERLKGNPPKRFGLKENEPKVFSQYARSSRSSKCGLYHTSKASVARTRTVVVEHAKKMMIFNDQVKELKKKKMKVAGDLDIEQIKMELLLEDKQEEMKTEDLSVEDKKEVSKVIGNLKIQISTIKAERNIVLSDLEGRIESLNDEISNLKELHALNLADIAFDESSDEENRDEVALIEKQDFTKEWAEHQQQDKLLNQASKYEEVEIEEAKKKQQEEEDRLAAIQFQKFEEDQNAARFKLEQEQSAVISKLEDDRKEFVQQQAVERKQLEENSKNLVYSFTEEKPFNQKDVNSGIFPSNDQISVFTKAITDAIKLAGGGGQNDNSKFFARQTTGKDLPEFDGKPEKWPEFSSEYQRTTSLCWFSNAENLTRLRKALKGSALAAVQSLMVTPDNVPKMMIRLEEIFGNPRHIIKAMIDKVKNAQCVKEGKLESLIQFGQTVTDLSATIETLKSDQHLNNPYLIQELEEKLPVVLQIQWIEWVTFNSNRERNLRFFSEWMEIKMKVARELCYPLEVKDNPTSWHQNKKTEKVHATEHNVQGRSTCNFCEQEGHWASKCADLLGKSVEERKKLITHKKLCLSCLWPGHFSRDCRRARECGVNGCKQKHNVILHEKLICNTTEKTPQTKDIPKKIEMKVESSNTINEKTNQNEKQSRTILGAIPVILQGPKGETEVLAFLDNGSTVTLLEEEVASKIGLQGKKEPFCIDMLAAMKNYKDSRNVACTIKGIFASAKSFDIEEIRTIAELPLSHMSQDAKMIKERWPEFEKCKIPNFNYRKPKMLIGSKHIHFMFPRQYVESTVESPVALRCKLGWYLIGPNTINNMKKPESCFHLCESTERDDQLHQLVKKSFSTEEFGVKMNQDRPKSKEGQRALAIMKKTTVRVKEGDRFETGLLWKDDQISLPESKTMALHRLHCQERKMDRNPKFAAVYVAKIDEYLEKGFIRKLTAQESQERHPRLWYLPHFGVVNPNKPEKLRLVFDAAAKSHGVSLNNMLMQGPDMNNSLVSVLWKFRQYEVAFAGDIKDMFHRVFIRQEDRPAQRFLWRGEERQKPAEEYEMLVMVFGATCSPTSAQYVKNLNAEEYKKEYPEVCKVIQQNYYVDDFLHSIPSVKEAKALIYDVIHVQKKAGFEICNWTCNSKDVLKTIPEEILSKGLKGINLEKEVIPDERMLGMWWNPTTDEFTFKINYHKVKQNILSGEKRPTKREVLRIVMSVYDPLGFMGHFIVKAKILLQDIWRSGIGWDDDLTLDLTDRWRAWLRELHNIVHVRIPRCYSLAIPHAEEVTLHIFCDASEKAFAAIAFLRTDAITAVDVAIVSSKTRVAPLKPLSIPRLELQAAVMAARIAMKIKEELEIPIKETHYWSDSMTVLRWIRSDARTFKPFIAHRLGEIFESTDANQWHWVPTKLNVADDATRDNEEADISSKSRWFFGPEFLRKERQYWPKEKEILDNDLDIEDLELKVDTVHAIIETFNIPEMDRFSKYQRLLRTTAWIFRFVDRSRKLGEVTGELQVQELNRAERHLIKISQKENFREEWNSLNGGRSVSTKSRLYGLEPFVDKEGILKVLGRLGKAEKMTNVQKHPIILDPKQHFTKLLLQWYHELYGHQGQRTVVNETRQKFWILNCMSAVKKTFRSCPICKIKKVKPSVVHMADLPEVRTMSNVRPFTNTGMDYFGPFTVKIGRRVEKRWGVLFTCLSIRAVHLEVAAKLNTDSAILAIQRLSCRRGKPVGIYSDNGTNLHGADNELKKTLEELKTSDVATKLAVKGIQWHFNPPASPHMGGVWERLVGSVKRTMDGIMKDRNVTDETLYTVFTEVEYILNSRPLTEVSIDPKDENCLTPNHFLLGWSGGVTTTVEELSPPIWGEFQDTDLCHRKQWRTAQRLADHFWIRWVKEYLPTLTKRRKWLKEPEEVQVGDVVIIVDDQGPRNTWPKGLVTAVFPGQDKRVRVAEVKTATGMYRRSIVKLCKLDIRPANDYKFVEDEVPSSGGRM